MTAKAEQAWLDLLGTGLGVGILGSADCTPGYYNNEGQPDTEGWANLVGYPAGPTEYFRYLDRWRNSGEFEGLEFR